MALFILRLCIKKYLYDFEISRTGILLSENNLHILTRTWTIEGRISMQAFPVTLSFQ